MVGEENGQGVVDTRHVACCNECEWAVREVEFYRAVKKLDHHRRESGHQHGSIIMAPDERAARAEAKTS